MVTIRTSGDLTKNFSRREFVCKCPWGCGFGSRHEDIDLDLPEILQVVRNELCQMLNQEIKLVIQSGCRCNRWNVDPRVGGTPGSVHTKGKAADVIAYTTSGKRIRSSVVGDAVFRLYSQGRLPKLGGLGIYTRPPGKFDFVHLDTYRRGARLRRW